MFGSVKPRPTYTIDIVKIVEYQSVILTLDLFLVAFNVDQVTVV